jgi:hypothetical protein
MTEDATAEIIQFPKLRARPPIPAAQRDAGRERLLAALASLEEALAVQRAAIAQWRGSLSDLRGAVHGLGGSLTRYRDRLGALGERVAALNGEARQLEQLAGRSDCTPPG